MRSSCASSPWAIFVLFPARRWVLWTLLALLLSGSVAEAAVGKSGDPSSPTGSRWAESENDFIWIRVEVLDQRNFQVALEPRAECRSKAPMVEWRVLDGGGETHSILPVSRRSGSLLPYIFMFPSPSPGSGSQGSKLGILVRCEDQAPWIGDFKILRLNPTDDPFGPSPEIVIVDLGPPVPPHNNGFVGINVGVEVTKNDRGLSIEEHLSGELGFWIGRMSTAIRVERQEVETESPRLEPSPGAMVASTRLGPAPFTLGEPENTSTLTTGEIVFGVETMRNRLVRPRFQGAVGYGKILGNGDRKNELEGFSGAISGGVLADLNDRVAATVDATLKYRARAREIHGDFRLGLKWRF